MYDLHKLLASSVFNLAGRSYQFTIHFRDQGDHHFLDKMPVKYWRNTCNL